MNYLDFHHLYAMYQSLNLFLQIFFFPTGLSKTSLLADVGHNGWLILVLVPSKSRLYNTTCIAHLPSVMAGMHMEKNIGTGTFFFLAFLHCFFRLELAIVKPKINN